MTVEELVTVLRRLRASRATDLAGGLRPWAAAGLPAVTGGSAAIP